MKVFIYLGLIIFLGFFSIKRSDILDSFDKNSQVQKAVFEELKDPAIFDVWYLCYNVPFFLKPKSYTMIDDNNLTYKKSCNDLTSSVDMHLKSELGTFVAGWVVKNTNKQMAYPVIITKHKNKKQLIQPAKNYRKDLESISGADMGFESFIPHTVISNLNTIYLGVIVNDTVYYCPN